MQRDQGILHYKVKLIHKRTGELGYSKQKQRSIKTNRYVVKKKKKMNCESMYFRITEQKV